MKKAELAEQLAHVKALLESSELSCEALRGALADETVRLIGVRKENQRLHVENAMMRTHVCANTVAEQAAQDQFWRTLLGLEG